jgi:hypothetical protein
MPLATADEGGELGLVAVGEVELGRWESIH